MYRIIKQDEIKEIIAKHFNVSTDDIIVYSEITTSGSIIKCAISMKNKKENKE